MLCGRAKGVELVCVGSEDGGGQMFLLREHLSHSEPHGL